MYDNISEGQYLIKLLATAINNSQIDYPQEDFSWHNLFTLASFHNVANTAFYGIQKLPDISVVPTDTYDSFSSVANKYSAKEALQQFEIRQILQRFEQNQIRCIPLDGHVIKGYYPRPDMRYVSTLNLLTDAKAKSKIHVVLNSLGYTLVNTTQDRIHYLKDGNINLALRTSLLPERPEYSEYFEKILEKIVYKNGLHFVGSLSPEDFYVYTMAHLAHLYASGGAGIRSVLDIWVLLKRLSPTLDREYINEQFNKLDLNLFAYYMEEFSKIWFDEQQKPNGDNEIFDHMRSHLFENYKTQNYEKYNEKLKKSNSETNTENQSDKTAKISEEEQNISEDSIDTKKVFPSLEQMKQQYPILEKMPFLLPIYWLIRLVSLWNQDKE